MLWSQLVHLGNNYMGDDGANTVAVNPARRWGEDQACRRAQDTMVATVAFGKERLDPRRVLGFLHTTWLPLIPEHLPIHLRAVADLARAKRLWEGVA